MVRADFRRMVFTQISSDRFTKKTDQENEASAVWRLQRAER